MEASIRDRILQLNPWFFNPAVFPDFVSSRLPGGGSRTLYPVGLASATRTRGDARRRAVREPIPSVTGIPDGQVVEIAVKAIVRTDLDNDAAFRVSFLENERRKSLTGIDKAHAIMKLRSLGKSDDEIQSIYTIPSQDLRDPREWLSVCSQFTA